MYIWNFELKYREFGLGLGSVFILGGGEWLLLSREFGGELWTLNIGESGGVC